MIERTHQLHGVAGEFLLGGSRVAHEGGGMSQVANFNLPQPFYLTIAYGPTFPPPGNHTPYGVMSDARLAWKSAALAPYTLNTDRMESGEMSENVRDQVMRTLRELGFAPKGHAKVYQRPYPEYLDSVPYPRGFQVPNFDKFTSADLRTTYEHIGQYLAQISDMGINDVHKVRLFPLSLSSTTFNWFTSLAPNSIYTWVSLEEKFHEYFYNSEIELRLSDLTTVRQKYFESVTEYIKRLCETQNKCYSLKVRERNLVDLALVGLSSYLREKLEGQDFADVNQVLQRAVVHENCARDGMSHDRFREGSKDKERSNVGMVDESPTSDDDIEICVTEWVDTPKGKPVHVPFLKPGPGKRE
jgi:hypothetical protein